MKNSSYMDSQKWIPCSNKPIEEGKYLVCGKRGSIYIADYKGIWTHTYGQHIVKPVAYMPLPEPYKG